MDVAVKLEIFEGPLDLLLHLIRKNEVDIHDIPIALITKQYLEYLDLMRDLNIALAGDFLVMAATLTHIKSRTLLPTLASAAAEEEGEDPRGDLVSQLMEHQRLKEIAGLLEKRPRLDRDIFARGSGRQELTQALASRDTPEAISVGMFDLVEAFRHLLATRGSQSNFRLPAVGISLEERMSQLLEALRQRQTMAFLECFEGQSRRGDLVVTFLAVLELTRLGLIRVYQERQAEPEPDQERWGTLRLYFTPLEHGAEEEGEE